MTAASRAGVTPRTTPPLTPGSDLITLRRHLHAHPELGWAEHATTAQLRAELAALGLVARTLTGGVGLVCDLGGRAGPGGMLLLRADLDALPLQDVKDVPYASTVPGVMHACGHDVHAAVLVGVARALTASPPPHAVRLLFQPAEEVMPGGALAAVQHGALDGVGLALALHCDPSLDVGHLGTRVGPLTSASDILTVTVKGPGGHTSRPQNTVDLVHVLGELLTGLPAALSRRVDPRASLSLVWGSAVAGTAANAIPRSGVASGTVRTLSTEAWAAAPAMVTAAARGIADLYGAEVVVDYQPGVPPVRNDPRGTALLEAGGVATLGVNGVVPTPQSLGGEDFGWVSEAVPAAMARLGTRTPGGVTHDLHQPGFDVDERAIAVGVGVLVRAVWAIGEDG